MSDIEEILEEIGLLDEDEKLGRAYLKLTSEYIKLGEHKLAERSAETAAKYGWGCAAWEIIFDRARIDGDPRMPWILSKIRSGSRAQYYICQAYLAMDAEKEEIAVQLLESAIEEQERYYSDLAFEHLKLIKPQP